MDKMGLMDELWKAIIPWFLRVFGSAVGLVIAFMFIKSATLPSQLTGTVRRGWSRARKNYKESAPGAYRARKKAEDRREVQTGNYSGRSPIKRLGSSFNRSINRNGLYNRYTRGYGAARGLDVRSQNLEDQKKQEAVFGGDWQLEEAWIQDRGVAGQRYHGGTHVKDGDGNLSLATGGVQGAYNAAGEYVGTGLNQGQRGVFDQMVRDGSGKKAGSFIAAMRGVAQAGRGDGAMLGQVYEQIRALNPETQHADIHSLSEEARGIWRSAGRGDLVGDSSGGAEHQTTFDAGWKEVDPHNISRHVFETDASENYINPEGVAGFKEYITASDEKGLRAIVRALDEPWKDDRAKVKVEQFIQDNETQGRSIDQLREHFADKVKTV